MNGACGGCFAGRYRRCPGDGEMRIRRIFGLDGADARVSNIYQVVTVGVVIGIVAVLSFVRA